MEVALAGQERDAQPGAAASGTADASGAAALRRREGYEGLLRHAQQKWQIELHAEPELLSAAMGACCKAGWVQHALACNA